VRCSFFSVSGWRQQNDDANPISHNRYNEDVSGKD
jgi:hypothetical protein